MRMSCKLVGPSCGVCCCLHRGYIVDVSLKGTSVEPDTDDMEAAYGEGTTPADVLQVGSAPC